MATSQNGHDYLRTRLCMGFRFVVVRALGKKRSVLVQFFVCLTLALVAFVIQDSVSVYLSGQSQVLPSVAFLLGNPLLAVVYLSVPYLFMVTIDIRARRKARKEEHTRATHDGERRRKAIERKKGLEGFLFMLGIRIQ